MSEPTAPSAPETATPVTEPTEQEFKERFPEAEKAEKPQEEDLTKPSVTRIHACSDGKYRNDEQYEVYKKYNEQLDLKKAQFNKDPDDFIHIDDVVMAVVVSDKGRGCIFGRYPVEETKAALCTLTYRFYNVLSEMDYAQQIRQAQKDGLVGPDGRPIAKKQSGIIV